MKLVGISSYNVISQTLWNCLFNLHIFWFFFLQKYSENLFMSCVVRRKDIGHVLKFLLWSGLFTFLKICYFVFYFSRSKAFYLLEKNILIDSIFKGVYYRNQHMLSSWYVTDVAAIPTIAPCCACPSQTLHHIKEKRKKEKKKNKQGINLDIWWVCDKVKIYWVRSIFSSIIMLLLSG